MTIRTLLLASLFTGLTGFASADVERVLQHSFPQGAITRLNVQSEGGPVEIETRPSGGIEVTVTEIVKGRDERRAEEFRKAVTIDFDQRDGTAFVTVKGPKGAKRWFYDSVNFKVKATVPRAVSLEVSTGGGSIKVGTLTGSADLKTSGGSIETAVMGGPVKANTSGGRIFIGGAESDVEARTSGGGISIGQVKGASNLKTAGGPITVEAAQGPVQAGTSGGGIHVTFVGKLAGDSKLETSGGGIEVRMDKDSSFDLKAATSGGSVNVDFPILVQGTAGRKSAEVNGKVGGGGPVLALHTSGGSIHVDPR